MRLDKNDLFFENAVITSIDDKGELNGKCNITSCQKPNSATWYNHSTQKYYCPSCAKRLNNDIFNKPAALDMFGHDLCTVVK
jgi:transposase-like protein